MSDNVLSIEVKNMPISLLVWAVRKIKKMKNPEELDEELSNLSFFDLQDRAAEYTEIGNQLTSEDLIQICIEGDTAYNPVTDLEELNKLIIEESISIEALKNRTTGQITWGSYAIDSSEVFYSISRNVSAVSAYVAKKLGKMVEVPESTLEELGVKVLYINVDVQDINKLQYGVEISSTREPLTVINSHWVDTKEKQIEYVFNVVQEGVNLTNTAYIVL